MPKPVAEFTKILFWREGEEEYSLLWKDSKLQEEDKEIENCRRF